MGIDWLNAQWTPAFQNPQSGASQVRPSHFLGPQVSAVLGSMPQSGVRQPQGLVAQRVGFHHKQVNLNADVDQKTLLSVVSDLNKIRPLTGFGSVASAKAPQCHGGAGCDRPAGDVDGFHPINAGLLSQGRKFAVPCTPRVMRMLQDAQIETSGKHAVIVGSDIVESRWRSCCSPIAR